MLAGSSRRAAQVSRACPPGGTRRLGEAVVVCVCIPLSHRNQQASKLSTAICIGKQSNVEIMAVAARAHSKMEMRAKDIYD